MSTFSAIPGSSVAPSAQTTVLQPRAAASVNLSEVWRCRDLLGLMAWRDVQVRYKQTALGAAWAVLQPLVLMIVFTFVFGRFLGVARKLEVPYPIFAYAGLLPWTLFTASVTAASNSLVANAALLRKVYFPRLIMPLAAMGAPLVDFLIAMAVLAGMIAYFGTPITTSLLLLPVLLAATFLAALGVGVLISAMTVTYRDLRHVVPFMLQAWLFITPVIYPLDLGPHYVGPVDLTRVLLHLNPMAGTISAFRAVILGTPLDLADLLVSVGSALLILALGLKLFAAGERRFADVV